ncbi:MAG: YdhR family protein [Chloroflexi bacterium]|nr:YdhR family protein [Chloroflexota bacterium]MBV9602447.1 YdhR family protein [Chloroflexota bacterium]
MTPIIQIVQFRLAGISDAEYREHAELVAPRFRHLPGLVSKVWLANVDANTFGGLYTWRDRVALEQYRAGDTYAQLTSNPRFVELSDREFTILASPTQLTAPALLAG